MRFKLLVLSLVLAALMPLAACAANLNDTTTYWYLTEGKSPSGLALTQDSQSKLKGWTPTRTITADKPLTWYTSPMTGDIAGGMWTLNLWAARQKTHTTIRVEIFKTGADGKNEVKLGSAESVLNFNYNRHDITNVTVKVDKAPMNNELIALRITKVTGDDTEIAFNANDYDASLAMVGTTPFTPAPGSVMNFTFRNCTNQFTDDEIYWTLDQKTWHSLKEGLVVPMSGRSSGRIYMRIQVPKTATTPAFDKRDFLEYNLNATNIYINTTQVDELQVPLTIEVEDTAGNTLKSGISEGMPALLDEFKNEVPKEFLTCLIDGKIVSAGGAGLRQGGPYADYFKKYVDDVWAMYATPTKTPGGWTGHVEGTALIFVSPDGKTIKRCNSKPNTQDIVAGPGGTHVLDSNPDFCGCCNRGVLEDPADWTNPDKFYQKPTCNFYAKFMHSHTINSKAYGFSYDDAQQQDTLIAAKSGRATNLIIGVYWADAPGTVTTPPAVTPPVTTPPVTTPPVTAPPATTGTPRPDLVITSISWDPAAPKAGDKVTFMATVKNQGAVATTEGTIIGARFQVDNNTATFESDNENGALSPGRSVVLEVNGGTAGATWTATTGKHTITATVDDMNRFIESDKTNNTLKATLTVP